MNLCSMNFKSAWGFWGRARMLWSLSHPNASRRPATSSLWGANHTNASIASAKRLCLYTSDCVTSAAKYSLQWHFARHHPFQSGKPCPFPDPGCAHITLDSVMHFVNHAADGSRDLHVWEELACFVLEFQFNYHYIWLHRLQWLIVTSLYDNAIPAYYLYLHSEDFENSSKRLIESSLIIALNWLTLSRLV